MSRLDEIDRVIQEERREEDRLRDEARRAEDRRREEQRREEDKRTEDRKRDEDRRTEDRKRDESRQAEDRKRDEDRRAEDRRMEAKRHAEMARKVPSNLSSLEMPDFSKVSAKVVAGMVSESREVGGDTQKVLGKDVPPREEHNVADNLKQGGGATYNGLIQGFDQMSPSEKMETLRSSIDHSPTMSPGGAAFDADADRQRDCANAIIRSETNRLHESDPNFNENVAKFDSIEEYIQGKWEEEARALTDPGFAFEDNGFDFDKPPELTDRQPGLSKH